MLDNPFRQPVGDTGKAGKQFQRGGIEIDTDLTNTRFHRLPKPASKLTRLDLAVELADPEQLRVKLDQFTQRVLKPSGQRDRVANRGFHVG